MFWRLLEREADWLPPWRELLRVYRRLEARGEIRGGRFVAGFSGEQFALPEAVGMLREVRRQPASGAWVSLSGADPLNLVGILTPGAKLAALTGNRVLYRDGLPIAVLSGGEVQFLEKSWTRRRNGRLARPCCAVPCRHRSSIWLEGCTDYEASFQPRLLQCGWRRLRYDSPVVDGLGTTSILPFATEGGLPDR